MHNVPSEVGQIVVWACSQVTSSLNLISHPQMPLVFSALRESNHLEYGARSLVVDPAGEQFALASPDFVPVQGSPSVHFWVYEPAWVGNLVSPLTPGSPGELYIQVMSRVAFPVMLCAGPHPSAHLLEVHLDSIHWPLPDI